jgi:porin
MTTPADMNVYTQYYELRLYQEGTFGSRPNDMVSLVSSHSVYSKYTIKNLAAEGKSYWERSNSITGSYSLRIARGVYSSLGLSYVTGPAVTPRVPNALTFNIQSNLFF